MSVYFNLKRTAKYVNKLKTLSIALFQTKAKANTTKKPSNYFFIIPNSVATVLFCIKA